MKKRLFLQLPGLALTAAVLLLSMELGSAQNVRAAVDCTLPAIQGLAPPDTTIVSATPVSTPAYCDVIGYVTTTNPGPNQVKFELGLPTAWNGLFAFIGNSGFASNPLDSSTIAPGVSFGFAVAVTDTGHEDFNPGNASWALNNRAKQDDWLYRSVHVSTVASKAIIRAFYDQPVGSAFFLGCSTGGRQGLLEAEQYPTDFDGIMAGAPSLGNYFAGHNWNAEHVTASPDNYIPPDKIALLDAAVLQSCDATDGVVDGLIQDPRKCTFNPSHLRCKHGNDSNCLTAEQVKTVKAIYAGASTEDGEQIYPGFTKSDPGGDWGWIDWITGSQPPNAPGTAQPWVSPAEPPLGFTDQDQFLKFFVFSDPNYNSLTFDLNNRRDRRRLAAVINRGGAAATNPDLSAFVKRGGKLIIYHGWSDAALSPLETVRYYRDVVRTMGGVDRTQQSVRLFMAPGMHHCAAGPGPNNFDAATAVVFWVLAGAAPDQIIATHYQNNDPSTGVVTRTMPLCPYPAVATFTGGDVNVAANWVCQRPANQHSSPGADE